MKPPLHIEPWLDARSPAEYFAALALLPGALWLDSAARGGASRWSIMTACPRRTFRCRGDSWEISGTRASGGEAGAWGALCQFVRDEMAVAGAPEDCTLPFAGGVAGYLGYDLGRLLERFRGRHCPAAGEPPDATLAAYDRALLWDHREGRAWRVNGGLDLKPLSAAVAEPELRAPPVTAELLAEAGLEALSSKQGYLEAVERTRAWIESGDVYQINLAQRFRQRQPEPAAALYPRLRHTNPGPFSAFFDFGGGHLLSTSPERFWEFEGGRVHASPIKGTRPRGTTPAEDTARRAELAASDKEQAELRMIVDLLRNDLGRVCRPGSIRVAEEGRLETFASVHHRVADIVGELAPGHDVLDLLAASLPGGSITGAPKIRAMEIIDALEPFRRGPFCGSIGYFSRSGRADFNIAIRTVVHRGTELTFDVGSGIVWDSEPEAEYAETLAKAGGIVAALQRRGVPA
ncbi:MAG: aminodeoxychorismate synthase component I [Opitutales bacterium]